MEQMDVAASDVASAADVASAVDVHSADVTSAMDVGCVLPRRPTANGQNNINNEDKPHVTNILHGIWNLVYSWPPRLDVPDLPVRIILEQASKLENVLFGCQCSEEISDKLHPIKVTAEKAQVLACEMVDQEAHVLAALDRINCECRATPPSDKIVAYPLNESLMLLYQRIPRVVYTEAEPHTVLLLSRSIPHHLEIDHALSELGIKSRKGDFAFKIKHG